MAPNSVGRAFVLTLGVIWGVLFFPALYATLFFVGFGAADGVPITGFGLPSDVVILLPVVLFISSIGAILSSTGRLSGLKAATATLCIVLPLVNLFSFYVFVFGV